MVQQYVVCFINEDEAEGLDLAFEKRFVIVRHELDLGSQEVPQFDVLVLVDAFEELGAEDDGEVICPVLQIKEDYDGSNDS